MKIDFFSSDHHFWHTNVIGYCKRPYASVEEMDEALIDNWNKIVGLHDTVLYLGDFSLSHGAVTAILPRLNGIKLLIPGNHDHVHPVHARTKERLTNKETIYKQAGFEILPLSITLNIAGCLVETTHMPFGCQKYSKYAPTDTGQWLLHGHVHEKWQINAKMINVGVDVWDYKPVAFETIEKIINRY